jgi:hypothetical protein
MLICDVHGLPLLPRVLAEPIGKSMVKKDQGLSAKKSKAEKAAMRKGVDVKKAVADVLCRAVRLPIPSAAEIVIVWRMLVKVDLPASDPAVSEVPAPDRRVSCVCAYACDFRCYWSNISMCAMLSRVKHWHVLPISIGHTDIRKSGPSN